MKRTTRLWVIFYTGFALNIECAHSMVQLSTGKLLVWNCDAALSERRSISPHHLAASLPFISWPQTEASSRTPYTTHHQKRLRTGKKPTLHDFTHTLTQTSNSTLALLTENSKRWQYKGHGMETVWNSSTSTF